MKKIKFIAYIGLVVLGIIQFFPTDKNESNLILDTDFMKVNKVPLKQIENSEMPLYSYTLMHRDAIFSEQEKLMVIDFMSRLKDSKE